LTLPYCLPNLTLPPEEKRPIGVWGKHRQRYLKQHHKILYYNLLTSGKLRSHLADVEEEAQSLFLRLVKEYAEQEGVTEQLKSNGVGAENEQHPQPSSRNRPCRLDFCLTNRK